MPGRRQVLTLRLRFRGRPENARRARTRRARDAHKTQRFWAAACALACVGSLHALPDDSEQPIQIQADQARSEPDGTSVLTGDVEINQGSLRVTAHRVTVATQDKRLHRIVAEGQADDPVRFRQRIDPGEPIASGRAETIDYAVSEDQLELTGNASLSLGDREFAGDLIHWNIKDGRVDARADDARRVTVKWLPEPQPEE